MDKYVFPAVFDPAEEGGYTVTFPDQPGCITEGDTMEEAYQMPKECLTIHLWSMEDDGDYKAISTSTTRSGGGSSLSRLLPDVPLATAHETAGACLTCPPPEQERSSHQRRDGHEHRGG